MGITHVPAGKNPPEDIFVHIEIPEGSNVKFEVGDEGTIFVDRFVHTPMNYPANYGYIPNTLGNDGDPVDVLVITPEKLPVGVVINARPVGVILMEDEGGMDEKIIAVPTSKLSPMYDHVKEVTDLPKHLLDRMTHFFERYKDLEKGKWAKVQGTEGAEKAKSLILEGIERAK